MPKAKSKRKSNLLDYIKKGKVLGKGGYGQVYICHMTNNKNLVYALKQIGKVTLVMLKLLTKILKYSSMPLSLHFVNNLKYKT